MFLARARDTPISSRPPPIPISRSQIREDSYTITENSCYTLQLRKVDIGNTSRTYLVKTYHDNLNSGERFSIELASLLNPCSECYPELVAVAEDDHGSSSLVMELPHHQAWRTARPSMSSKEKNSIIQCYEDIHACGILHGSVSLKNVIVGVDGTVALINFGKAYCLDTAYIKGVPTCTPKALDTEMRAIKYLLNYEGVRRQERSRRRLTPRGTSTVRPGQYVVPIKEDVMDKWEEDADMEELSDYFVIPEEWKNTHSPIAPDPYPMIPTKAPEIAIAEKLERIKTLRVAMKRIRDEEASDRLQESTRKRPRNIHRVAFHPDTDDNSLWAAGGGLPRRHRQSTPFPFEDDDDDGNSSEVEVEQLCAASNQSELHRASAVPGTYPLSSVTLRNSDGSESTWVLDKPAFLATLQFVKTQRSARPLHRSSPKPVFPPLTSSRSTNVPPRSKGPAMQSHISRGTHYGRSKGKGANDWHKRYAGNVLKSGVSSALLPKARYWLRSRS